MFAVSVEQARHNYAAFGASFLVCESPAALNTSRWFPYFGRQNRRRNQTLVQNVNDNCSFTGEFYSRISIIIQIIQTESPPQELYKPLRRRGRRRDIN
jgi:hypothetical protein